MHITRNSGKDHVDTILQQWKRERPDLDTTPMGIIGRISRAERLIDEQMKAACAQFDLERWGFDVLATLRRSGKPYRLTPTQLYSSLMLTSGAMTNRIDRLETAGLVKRSPDPGDRRGVFVCLTEDGRKLIDKAIAHHMEVEQTMLRSLSSSDRTKLAGLLRAVLRNFEGTTEQEP
ncbi:MarR family winged helix-turn-helix transcriptional regulator [Terriglobus sp. 2YAB30_2]|uniref:MarR family winged helix-turn-helix transcriptional regulator n=1 Tax=unclassified Terriglobus TaxID=2628988 RepID=UPI003F9CA8B9